jgi:hypothetical protein
MHTCYLGTKRHDVFAIEHRHLVALNIVVTEKFHTILSKHAEQRFVKKKLKKKIYSLTFHHFSVFFFLGASYAARVSETFPTQHME